MVATNRCHRDTRDALIRLQAGQDIDQPCEVSGMLYDTTTLHIKENEFAYLKCFSRLRAQLMLKVQLGTPGETD